MHNPKIGLIQDLRTDNANTVITTIGSNPKPLKSRNECVSPIILNSQETYYLYFINFYYYLCLLINVDPIVLIRKTDS